MAVARQQGPDGERKIEVGAGVVTKIERPPGARNAYVTITPTHNRDLRYPVRGYLDTTVLELFNVITPGHPDHHGGRVMEYRIETHRRTGVDAAIPLDDLESGQTVRDLVLLRPAADEEGGDRPHPSPPAAPTAEASPAADRSGTAGPSGRAGAGRPLSDILDLAQSCVLLAYHQVAARYPGLAGDELAAKLKRVGAVFVEMTAATPAPQRAVEVLAALLAEQPVPFGAPAGEVAAWQARLESDLEVVLAAAAELIAVAA